MADDLSVKLEILRMAREIVNNEYVDKRAQDHNKWLADSEKLSSRGIKIPYPDIPPYPDEAVVIAKAKSLLGFVGMGDAEDVHPIKREEPPIKKVEVEKVQAEEVVKEKPAPKSDEELFREYAQKRSAYEAEEETPSSSRMIGALLKQLDDLKRMRRV